MVPKKAGGLTAQRLKHFAAPRSVMCWPRLVGWDSRCTQSMSCVPRISRFLCFHGIVASTFSHSPLGKQKRLLASIAHFRRLPPYDVDMKQQGAMSPPLVVVAVLPRCADPLHVHAQQRQVPWQKKLISKTPLDPTVHGQINK
jgi:hypothetical protein